MDTIYNFRDIGGLPTRHGLRLKSGMIYRSGSISNASQNDLKTLAALGIKTICDLRAHQERVSEPDRLPGGIPMRYVHIPITVKLHNRSGALAQLYTMVFGDLRRLQYDTVLKNVYQQYVTDFRQQFAQVLKMAANHDNLPLLIHCAAGKDRTGFACCLIQLALGVAPEQALEDYLQSNAHLEAFKERMLNRLRFTALFGIARERWVPLFSVQKEYMESAWEQMKRDFGSLDGYLANGLSFSDEDRLQLQRLLLEDIQ